MAKWMIDHRSKHLPKLRDPVLIEGLPGIGNVGKIAVDFMIDELQAMKVLDMFSYSFPHSVFINDKNLVELPSIALYHKKMGQRDVLFLGGDIQPVDDVSCYEFCEEIITISKGYGVKDIITLGGIGLSEAPEKPKVYMTGNSKDAVALYAKGTKANTKLFGVVGPIIGVSGILVGLAGRSDIRSVCMLAETFGHPMYLGMKGAREIIKILTKKLDLKINLREMDKEITNLEEDIKRKTENLFAIKQQSIASPDEAKENNYIG